jgi:hypothetical protein
VVVERDAAVYAVEFGADESESGSIGWDGVPQGDPSAIVENAELCVDSVGADHAAG